MRKKIIKCVVLVLISMLLFGCGMEQGTKERSKGESSVETIANGEVPRRSADAWQYYTSQVQQLPEGVAELENALPEGEWLSIGAPGKDPYFFEGDVIHRYLTVWGWDGQDENSIRVERYYLQTLRSPYREWETQEIGDADLGSAEKILTLEQEQLELIFNTVGGYAAWNKGSDGRIYFGNQQGIYTLEKDEPKTLINLQEGDLALTELTGFLPGEEEFVLFGKFGNKEYLIKLQKSEQPVSRERQEILLADSFVGADLKNAIAEFNFLNQEYRIVTKEAGGMDYADYRQRLQLEVTSGEGPDLLGFGVFLEDWVDYAEKGYLMPLDDIYEGEEEQFWDFVLESGIVNGKRYAIPVSYNIKVALCSREFAKKAGATQEALKSGNFHFRDAGEMMEAVRKSGAELAVRNLMWGESSAFNLLYFYGIKNTADKTYIDWENGISHLNEEPFIELLQFAKEYTDGRDLFAAAELQESLQSGRIAFAEWQMTDLSDILYFQALFGDEEVFVGFPGVDAKNCYAIMSYLMINQASEQKEGAKAFLQFLISREGQNALTAQGQRGKNGVSGSLCLRRDAFEEAVETRLRMKKSGKPSTVKATTGEAKITYDMDGFTEKNVKELRMLMEHAKLWEYDTDAIEAILEEETAAFFEGGRSAAETAEICHGRVQLYLDENR